MLRERFMQSAIAFEGKYIRAELSGRRTAEETKKFLESVAAAALAHRCPRALISVRNSTTLFKVEEYGISDYFKVLGGDRSYRVALVSDSEEIRISHEYIVLLAQQYGAQVASFRDDAAAVEWLNGG